MMSKTALALLLSAAGASAFAPSTGFRTTTFLNSAEAAAADVVEEEAPEPTPEPPAPPAPALSAFAGGLVGNEGPEPMPLCVVQTTSVDFDPCGFAKRAPEWVPWFREAELKHGRAAMLASLGFVVPEFFRIPGEQFSFENVPTVIEAHDKLPDSMSQIFLWISLIESCSIPALAGLNNPAFDRAPGDFSFDPLGLYPTDPEKQKEMQLAELKNGRLAMIAVGGMVAGASVTGGHFPYLQ